MYHDPLNTQIMIAIERFHLFSPAAQKRKTPTAAAAAKQQHTSSSSNNNNLGCNNKYCTPITVLWPNYDYSRLCVQRTKKNTKNLTIRNRGTNIFKNKTKRRRVQHSECARAHNSHKHTHTRTHTQASAQLHGQSQACTFRSVKICNRSLANSFSLVFTHSVRSLSLSCPQCT